MKTRPHPAAGHVAMAAAALWLLLPCVLAATSGLIVISLFIVAPLIAATAADERRTAIVAAAAVVLTLAAGPGHGPAEDANSWIRFTAVCAMGLLAVVLAGVRRRREEHLARMTAIAKASQVALLPPVPPEITGISIAARYRSATPGAPAGGDLYEIIPTGHGIRVIIGDVRGNGLDAIRLARHVLSAFRRSAVAVPALEHVAGDVSRAIRPHLGEEDFVTAALVQIAPGGELTVVNCGHHPPLLHHGGLRPVTGPTAALPLGLEDDFTAVTTSWRPGDRLYGAPPAGTRRVPAKQRQRAAPPRPLSRHQRPSRAPALKSRDRSQVRAPSAEAGAMRSPVRHAVSKMRTAGGDNNPAEYLMARDVRQRWTMTHTWLAKWSAAKLKPRTAEPELSEVMAPYL